MAKRKKRRKYKQEEYYSLTPETKKAIFIIILFLIATLSILSFLNLAGTAGIYINWALSLTFGAGKFIFPLALIILGYILARPNKYEITLVNYLGLFLFFVSFYGLLHIKYPIKNAFDYALSGYGGGALGYGIDYYLLIYLGLFASVIFLLALLFIGSLLMINNFLEKISNLFSFIFPTFKIPKNETNDDDDDDYEEDEDDDDEEEDDEESTEKPKFSPINTKKKLFQKEVEEKPEPTKIKTPNIKIDLPLSLLDNKISKPTSGDINVGMDKIERTLHNFNINVEMHGVKVGPTVTQFTLKPAEGIKLSKITSLSNDLALALAAHPIRIEAPIPGKSLVGIEVPNQKPAIVRLREILESKNFKNRTSNQEVPLGKDVSGTCWTYNITKMPHLLVAGATGAGKSVCLNSIIMSLLYQNNPEDLRFIFVDPKRVELTVYNGIPHLLAPVITDVTKTVYALRWAINEMDRRYDELAKHKKRNIASYNQSSKEKMPYIVIVIDELADLMVAAANEIETSIIRLTQMARAIGIHLIVATQRPSVDVITGLIKANIPCRIAFSVASQMDSRTILDSSGAEKLVGKGDMLFISPDTSSARRMQGAFVSDDEIKRVVDFLKSALPEDPTYNDEITSKPNGKSSFDFQGGKNSSNNDDGDDLFEEAKEIVIKAGKASSSLLQRRLRVGYARAARLIDLLEDAGIVSEQDGSKPREILVDENSYTNNVIEEDEIEEIDENEDNETDTEDEEIDDENQDDEENNDEEEDDDDNDDEEEDDDDNDNDEEDIKSEFISKKKITSDDEIY